MSNQATGQEKKDGAKKESYDEMVSIRPWTGSKFNNPIKDIPAFRGQIKDKMVFYTQKTTDLDLKKGSEIIDKDGVAYVVDNAKKSAGNFSFHLVYVTKKTAEEKKP